MSPERVAEVVVWAVQVYSVVGLVFALAFVSHGVQRLDASARGAGLGFRLLILPGCAALWPLLLRRWLGGQEPPEERNAHRDAAGGRQQGTARTGRNAS